MEILTYSLRDGEGSSDRFYGEAARFADAVLLHGESRLIPAANEFRRYVIHSGVEPVRSVEEYAFELLTLGVLWRTYGGVSENLPPWQGRLLSRLVRLRNGSVRLKPAADKVRGLLNAAWLTSSGSVPSPSAAWLPLKRILPALEGLDQLLLWLTASGEFVQEAARFRIWQRYLIRLPVREARNILLAALDEGVWFEAASEAALGRFTEHVESYRQRCRSRHSCREDAVFRNRRRVEYHLNLTGAELMNRFNRSDYDQTLGKAVLLPICLKLHSRNECAANRSGNPNRCLRCTSGCRVAQITALGEQYGFEVIIVPHESDAFSRQLTERLVRDRVGIIGIACALNLLAGGWRAKALGLPAQCVVLDYCGCSAHWDDQGFPTDLNLSRLMDIMGIKSIIS